MDGEFIKSVHCNVLKTTWNWPWGNACAYQARSFSHLKGWFKLVYFVKAICFKTNTPSIINRGVSSSESITSYFSHITHFAIFSFVIGKIYGKRKSRCWVVIIDDQIQKLKPLKVHRTFKISACALTCEPYIFQSTSSIQLFIPSSLFVDVLFHVCNSSVPERLVCVAPWLRFDIDNSL